LPGGENETIDGYEFPARKWRNRQPRTTQQGFAMPNDARLGLVVGVGLVIMIAVLFYRKDLPAQPPAATSALPSGTNVAAGLPAVPSPGAGRHHTVRAGETLAQLATHYYGAAGREDLIRQANRGLARQPAPGTVLLIPDAADAP
jgi:nucleoid-associated protein YgaU